MDAWAAHQPRVSTQRDRPLLTTGIRLGASNFWVRLMYLPPARGGYGVRRVCLTGLNWIWLAESAYSHLTGECSPALNEYYTHDSMGEYPDQPVWSQVLTAPPSP